MVVLTLLRTLRLVAEALPQPWITSLGGLLGDAVMTCGLRRRRVREHMRSALGLQGAALRRLVRANYRYYGITVIEFLRLRRILRRDLDRLVRWEHPERFDGPYPGGMLILAGHLGNYPLMAGAVARRGVPMAIVIKRVKNRTVERFWLEQLAGTGVQVLFNRDSMREILQVLRDDRVLIVIYDQHDSRGGVWVDFLGRPAAAFRALPILARRVSRPVLPAYGWREPDGTHVIRCDAPIAFPATGDPEGDIREMAQRCSDRLAAAIRAHPDQWLWMHRRWRTPPPDAPLSEAAVRLLQRGDGAAESESLTR